MSAHNQRFLSLVGDTRNRIKEINVDQARTLLEQDSPPALIDVREESEYAAAHLPGAKHMGKGVIERDIEKQFPDTDTHMILYCGGGYRSALAADNLQKMGYTNVISMDGGFKGWVASGLPVTTD